MSLLKSASTIAGSSVISQLIGALSIWLISHKYDMAEVGLYALNYSIAVVGAQVCTFASQLLIPKEAAIKWSAAPDMTPQTVLYRRPVAQFSNFQPKIVSSWLILALFQANFLISGRSRLCPYQLVNSNQVRQGE
ncbi:hypothetical protein STN0717CIT36_10790 [Citrobacter portucalensis]|nr:hypothetical protein STW0522CIT30_11450 [Citrobacter portucalensis]BBW15655.1 hypothetical protein STN0717CIT36_10790 [Citrobacter portucalensis]